MNCHYWKTTHCQTDYLPSDVQAAPARATVREAVELAVLTACDTVMLIKDLPLVSGDGSQLPFRDHSYLGLVAVFDQYLLEDRRSVLDLSIHMRRKSCIGIEKALTPRAQTV